MKKLVLTIAIIFTGVFNQLSAQSFLVTILLQQGVISVHKFPIQ